MMRRTDRILVMVTIIAALIVVAFQSTVIPPVYAQTDTTTTTLTPSQERHQQLLGQYQRQQQQQGQQQPQISQPQIQQGQQQPLLPTEEWDPLEPGPIPTPPPTSDRDLIRFNELFSQCKAGQDKIASLQGNSYDHANQNTCINAMRNAIMQYCENFQTYDAAKCSYVNRPDVILFLEMNDYLFGFGDTTPTTGLGGLSTPLP